MPPVDVAGANSRRHTNSYNLNKFKKSLKNIFFIKCKKVYSSNDDYEEDDEEEEFTDSLESLKFELESLKELK